MPFFRHIKEQTPCDGCGARFQRRKGLVHHSEGCLSANVDNELHDQGVGALPVVSTTSSLPVPTNNNINPSTACLLPCSVGCVNEDGSLLFEVPDLVKRMITAHLPKEQHPEVLGILQQQGGTSQFYQPDATIQPPQPLVGSNDASQSDEQGHASEYVRPSDDFWSAAASEDYDM
ncbi:hypothetical protein F5Y02DRAFT_421312 [Annulohypoxylon stygium]|nr:hypothetical protein F5Y02DRAFT_421312 [Annulohypoxylon stygium]